MIPMIIEDHRDKDARSRRRSSVLVAIRIETLAEITEPLRDEDALTTSSFPVLVVKRNGPHRERMKDHRHKTRGSSREVCTIVVYSLSRSPVDSRAVLDRDAPSSKKAIAELQKEGVSAGLYQYALWRTQSEADAEDLVADALVLVLDPEAKPWDPTKASFSRHTRLVMDRLATRGRTAAMRGPKSSGAHPARA